MLVRLVHEREEEPAGLTIRLAAKVEHATTRQPFSASAEDDDGELVVVVPDPGHHAGAMEQHGVVEEGAFAFADSVELAS